MIGLVKIYRTDDRKIHEEDELTEGVWVQMVNPSEGEGEEYARKLDVDISDLLAALDEEEGSRIGWLYADPGGYSNDGDPYG